MGGNFTIFDKDDDAVERGRRERLEVLTAKHRRSLRLLVCQIRNLPRGVKAGRAQSSNGRSETIGKTAQRQGRTSYIPSASGVLESKVRVWSRSPDPIDSIGQLLSITVGRNTPAEDSTVSSKITLFLI